MSVLYFRGVSPGFSFVQSQWSRQVQKASAKFAGPSPLAAGVQDPDSASVEAIRAKLKAGKKLSPAELKYLREHDPELYAKAVRVALDQEAYEKTLRRCEDREEAERVRSQKLARFANLAKRMDPEEAEMTANAISETDREFFRSVEYAALPEKKKKAGRSPVGSP